MSHGKVPKTELPKPKMKFKGKVPKYKAPKGSPKVKRKKRGK